MESLPLTATSSIDAPPLVSGDDLQHGRRGRLFRKYFVLILSLVTLAVLASSGISLYFTYQETRASIAGLQHEKALAAAARIEQYMRQIERQLAYAALSQLDAGNIESRRIEFLKLLRLAPEVTDVAQVGADGREQIAVSRLGMDSVDSGTDRSKEPAVADSGAGTTWFSPVYFRKETEPYMTFAVRAGTGDRRRGPVVIADVNLKFIWDVVSRIKVGDQGKAYVVDGNGFLIADPDIGLVLRKTSLARLPHVASALKAKRSDDVAMLSKNVAGDEVLTSGAPIDSLHWFVFVEQPASEVYRRLNASILRTAVLLLAGLALSAAGALALARGMVRPIRTLAQGAQRIGAGDLDQAIDVRTGDELEALAAQFNRMTSRLRESYAGLERKVEERTHELKNALDQQTAISEILRVISSSPTDVQPVLAAVAEHAAQLCKAPFARVLLVDGDKMRPAAAYVDPLQTDDADASRTLEVPFDRTSLTGRAASSGETVHHADVQPLLDTEYPGAAANMRLFRCRAVLAVPLVREGHSYGAIFTARREPRPFSADQIVLVQTFARQAAIAIDNVRLFNQTKEALEQQTAIAEILRVISSSPTDVQPVLDAIAERAARLCDAAAASVYLIDGGVLRHLASKGLSAVPVTHVESLPINRDSVSGRALLERKPLRIADLRAEAAQYPLSARLAQQHGHRSVAVVPLFREGDAVGTILLRRDDVRPFAERDMALLQTFGDQAAIALENIRLFNETKEALDRQTATSEVLKAISRATFDVAPVLDMLIENATRLCRAEKGHVFIRDGDVYRFVASHGAPPDFIEFMRSHPVPPGPGTAVGKAAMSRLPCQFEDATTDPEYTWSEAQRRLGFRTILAVPMLRQGDPVGVVVVWREEVRRFVPRDIALVTTFADQAVIALENVRLLREIQDKSRELEIANQHKSEFLANMSHELRTPLNAIIGFSEVLLERLFGELNPKQDDYLHDIHSSGRHLLTLINDILDLSKIEAGRMDLDLVAFDLPNAITDAMTLIRERAQRHGIALNLEVEHGLGEITADERKFKQILVNLLSNAVKFTPDGGRIDVAARRRDDMVEVAVTDTGIGIALEDQQRVFEKFRQAGGDYTSKQEGTGLGLALTKRFVELHGGSVHLRSEPGKGSTFSFTLPLQQ